MAKENNIVSFIKKMEEKGKIVKLPPPPVDVNQVEKISKYKFEFAYDVVKVDIFEETEVIKFTWLDKETNTVYQRIDLDYTSLHQLLFILDNIKKIKENDKTRT